MWTPPVLLAVMGAILGSFPALADAALINPAAQAIANTPIESPLKIWHGFNIVLLLSGITLATGSLLYFFKKPSPAGLNWIEGFNRISPENIIRQLARYFRRLSDWYTDVFHNGFLRSYLLRIMVFSILLLGYRILKGDSVYISLDRISSISFYEIAVGVILIGALYLAVTSPSRLTVVVGSGVIGYCICLIFMFYGAPDLAMTQFTIDTLTVVLFVLVLFRLPPFLNFANTFVRIRDGAVAIAFGALIALVALQALNEPIDGSVSKFYGDNAYVLAKGKNVVNVILVDFRGFDTMFEIVVLSIAALGVFSLIKLRLKSSEKE